MMIYLLQLLPGPRSYQFSAIAAKVVTVDIGGAFLNANMPDTRVKVHMRLDKVMTELLLKIDPG